MFADNDQSNIRLIAVIVSLLLVIVLLSRTGQADHARISVWQGQQNLQNLARANVFGGNTQPTGRGLNSDAIIPFGNPLNAANAVMTQGYGVGSHAPAHTWGAIDLALDSDGDGIADPEGTWSQPVYATHSGVVRVTPNSVPAGNHVWVINQEYKTGYAHLKSFAVTDGQMVERGTVIGYIGSTGQSSGPHLDYQVWHLEDDTWVNVNPLGYGVSNGLP
jgi:murein DD-endopeptidase MepM/ murein hydrolase activator NlpD